jgi:hypothetical protein
MNLSTCPKTVPQASSRSLQLPLSSSLDGMPATRSCGASLADITAGQQTVPWCPSGVKETRETMRKFLFIFAFFFVVLPIRATDLYIAQTATGASTGADCGDALPYTFFNSSSNWPSPIGPGTTVHICGTITAPAGASGFLTFQGSGVSGNPITLRFENGAVLLAPYWGVNGAINTNGNSFVIVDGNSLLGTIQATANGTGLANQNSNGVGVLIRNSSNVTVQNLNVINLYVHKCTGAISTCTDENGGDTIGIWLSESTSNINITNVTISGNVIHDVRWAVTANYASGGTASGYVVKNNTFYNIDHGTYMGDNNGNSINNSPIVSGNICHDTSNWDDANDSFHHDCLHISTAHAGSLINGPLIYNNYFYGEPGKDANTFIYIAGDTDGPNLDITGGYIFNNVLDNTSTVNAVANGYLLDLGQDNFVFNNTLIGYQNSNNGGVPLQVGDGGAGGGDYIYNNILSTGSQGIYFHETGTAAAMDYNVYYNLATLGRTDNSKNFYDSLSDWQSCNTTALGCPAVHDRNSVVANPLLNPGSNPPFQLLSSSSSAWQKGMNLSAYCATVPAACFDKAGVPRPAVGPWDIGAYESSQASNANAPQPPSNLAATVN